MKRILGFALTAVALLGIAGCGTRYSWRTTVPYEMRSVCVPTFRNSSDVAEVGALATRELLREFQREGTFKIRSEDRAALEVQGSIESVASGSLGYDRTTGMRFAGYELNGIAVITVVDKRNGKLIMDNRRYAMKTTYTGNQDSTTSIRDASARLVSDLARQVVDDMLTMNYGR